MSSVQRPGAAGPSAPLAPLAPLAPSAPFRARRRCLLRALGAATLGGGLANGLAGKLMGGLPGGEFAAAGLAASLGGGLARPAHAAEAMPKNARPTRSAAPRVAALSWAGAQMLVSLGVPPVALADLYDYPLTGALPAMPPDVIELGLPSEPNLELLQRLAPDLILLDASDAGIEPRLSSIAPTVAIDLYNPAHGRPYVRARAETLRLGALLGREAAARAYLESVEASLDACAKRIAALPAPPSALIVDLYDDGRHLYLYGPNSMMQDVLDRLGVRNAWHGSTAAGYLLVGIESLGAMGDATLYYISHGARDALALHNLSRSALWQSLPLVRERRLRPLPGFFTYGSASCAVQFATALAAALAGPANRAASHG